MHSLNKKFALEVAVDTFEQAVSAAKQGATRLELCAALSEGGLTPPSSLMISVNRKINIPVHVMIRPRRGDFLYSDAEFEQMQMDIVNAKSSGAKGVVFGILDSKGDIDKERMSLLVKLSKPMKVTCHRAFDMVAEPFVAMESLIGIGVDYILTSGGSQTAEDGFEVISELAKRALGRIVIMAGSGINPSNATLIAGTGVNDLHFTCRKSVQSSMSHKNFALGSMGSATGLTEYEIEIFDHEKFNGIRDALSRL